MYINSLNTLSKWRNPVKDIKDPLKQRWAEISQTMDTHINGVCPLHIYVNRRPLESQDTYALEYRVNNFQPLTKDPFDRFINGVIDVCNSANLQINIPEDLLNADYLIKGKPIIEFTLNDLVRVRENDPNAVVVVIPKVKLIDETSVSIVGVEVLIVPSSDIEKISKDDITFVYKYTDDKKKIFIKIDDGQYSISIPDENGKYSDIPIVSLTKRKPYIYISDNVVYEGKYTLRLPYSFGASAWGDKFYGQESDFTIQATRYTYLKEIRAKEKCDEAGMIFLNGVHCMDDITKPCGKCNGTGYVKDDSPLGTIYVDYSKLNSEERAFPQVIQWAEPPQTALTSSKDITDMYFERMCEALGLLKQNFTNQSGVSKAFDYKEKISTIYKIFSNNIRVAEEIYRFIEYILKDEYNQSSIIELVGELGQSDLNDILTKLSEAKKNQSPVSVISNLVDMVYYKTLPKDIAQKIIKTAKFYDKLYIYGSDEITTARAQLGNSLTEKDIIIHNTLIDVIKEYLTENGMKEADEIVKYLDTYYARFTVPTQTATSLGLL